MNIKRQGIWDHLGLILRYFRRKGLQLRLMSFNYCDFSTTKHSVKYLTLAPMKIHFSNTGTSRKFRVFFPGGYNRSFVCTVKPEMLRQESSNWFSRLTRIYSILWPPFASQNFWVLRTLNFNWFLLQGIYRHFTFKDRQTNLHLSRNSIFSVRCKVHCGFLRSYQ